MIDYKKLAEESSKADKALMKELVGNAWGADGKVADASDAKKPKVPRRKSPSAPGGASSGKGAAAGGAARPAFDVAPPEKEKGFRSCNAAANAILEAYFAHR